MRQTKLKPCKKTLAEKMGNNWLNQGRRHTLTMGGNGPPIFFFFKY